MKKFMTVIAMAFMCLCFSSEVSAFQSTYVRIPYSVTSYLDDDCDLTNEGNYKETYEFYGYEGDVIEVSLRSSYFDTVIYILDDRLKRIATDDDGGSGTNSYLEFELPDTGYYYVVASQYRRMEGSYHLSIDWAEGTVDDYGNDINTAETIRLSAGSIRSIYGEIEYGGDIDFFEFTAPITGDYVFRSYDSDMDPYGTLYDSYGDVLEYNDDYSGSDFRIVRRLVAGRKYFLSVRAFSSSRTGEYWLRITAPDEEEETITTIGGCQVNKENPVVSRNFRREQNALSYANRSYTYNYRNASTGDTYQKRLGSCFGLSSVAALINTNQFRTSMSAPKSIYTAELLSFGYDVSNIDLFSGSSNTLFSRSQNTSINNSIEYNPSTSTSTAAADRIASCIGYFEYYNREIQYACEDYNGMERFSINSNFNIDSFSNAIDNSNALVLVVEYGATNHALIPQRLYRAENKDSYILEVYDCNTPNVDGYFELKVSNGTVTSIVPITDNVVGSESTSGTFTVYNVAAMYNDQRFN